MSSLKWVFVGIGDVELSVGRQVELDNAQSVDRTQMYCVLTSDTVDYIWVEEYQSFLFA